MDLQTALSKLQAYEKEGRTSITYEDDGVCAEDLAKLQNCVVVSSTPTTLLLDFDTKEQHAQFWKVLPLVAKDYDFGKTQCWYSKSGSAENPFNVHVVIETVCAMEVYERIALETILGSDPRRSQHNLHDFIDGNNFGSKLFQPKDAVVYDDIRLIVKPTQQEAL